MSDNKWSQILHSLSLLSQVGFVMLASVGIGFGAGYFLDNWLERELIFKAMGLVIGIIAGFYTNYKLIMSIVQK